MRFLVKVNIPVEAGNQGGPHVGVERHQHARRAVPPVEARSAGRLRRAQRHRPVGQPPPARACLHRGALRCAAPAQGAADRPDGVPPTGPLRQAGGDGAR
mgnify:CR=1 FL=1